MNTIADNLKKLSEHIKKYSLQAPNSPSVTLVAVSKTRKVEEIKQCLREGQYHFGENYVQEALDKINLLADESITWHLIGHLQSNKAKLAANAFDWIQTIDSVPLAQKLNDFRLDAKDPINVLIQVNISTESTKSGAKKEDIYTLCDAIKKLPKLRLRGLMAIGTMGASNETKTKEFSHLKQIFDKLKDKGYGLDTLSMGMTDDMRVAIREGATMVRVGTGIFGPRDKDT